VEKLLPSLQKASLSIWMFKHARKREQVLWPLVRLASGHPWG
jgi:hypothetical protein